MNLSSTDDNSGGDLDADLVADRLKRVFEHDANHGRPRCQAETAPGLGAVGKNCAPQIHRRYPALSPGQAGRGLLHWLELIFVPTRFNGRRLLTEAC
jgi:hypothetical protein